MNLRAQKKNPLPSRSQEEGLSINGSEQRAQGRHLLPMTECPSVFPIAVRGEVASVGSDGWNCAIPEGEAWKADPLTEVSSVCQPLLRRDSLSVGPNTQSEWSVARTAAQPNQKEKKTGKLLGSHTAPKERRAQSYLGVLHEFGDIVDDDRRRAVAPATPRNNLRTGRRMRIIERSIGMSNILYIQPESTIRFKKSFCRRGKTGRREPRLRLFRPSACIAAGVRTRDTHRNRCCQPRPVRHSASIANDFLI